MITNLRPLIAGLVLCLSTHVSGAERGEAAPPIIDTRDELQQNILPQYEGKIVYGDFWASWCGPCRKSLPAMNELYLEFRDRGFEVLAINLDESAEDKQHFLERYPVDYRIVDDPTGINPVSYGIPGLPTAYMVDRNGLIHDIHIGFNNSDKARIRTLVEQLLEDTES